MGKRQEDTGVGEVHVGAAFLERKLAMPVRGRKTLHIQMQTKI